jgi:hypothetical protein
MKQILLALFALAAIASAACRQYDVDVYRNVNGKVPQGVYYGVGQSFVCTADSLLWADCFIGAANDSGSYHFVIQTPDQQNLFYGDTIAGYSVRYQYVRARLIPYTGVPKLIKGETYVLKVSLSDPHHPNDSLNYYYDNTDPYKYGSIQFPDLGYHPPPQPWEPDSDLCCRIEGVNRAVNRDFIGMGGGTTWAWGDKNIPGAMETLWSDMDTLGVGYSRESFYWPLFQKSAPGDSWWGPTDSMVTYAARHQIHILGLLCYCPDWASTHDSTYDSSGHSVTVWSMFCPPRNLYNTVLLNGGSTINDSNYWACFVWRMVHRYGPGGTFWSDPAHSGLPILPVTEWEVWNEPNAIADFWKTPDSGFGYPVPHAVAETIALQESLYARLCDVTVQAALAAGNAGTLSLSKNSRTR